MAGKTTNPSRSNKSNYRGGRSSKNAYKVGKLSRRTRFSSKKINFKLIFVLLALILSFVSAVILGNHLSKKAEDSKNTTTTNDVQNVVIPTPDKVSPFVNLNAFYVDFSNANPDISLSEQTGAAREKGNALYIELQDESGNLIYTSSAASEISYPCNANLTLDRLENHLGYYNDYAVGYFKSDFSPKLDGTDRTKIQAQETILLSEAAETAFSQLIIEFPSNATRDDVIYYQSYILNLKLSCKNTSVGVALPLSFIENASNHGVVAEIMKVADFYAFDIGEKTPEEINSSLSALMYFSERYDAVAIISNSDTVVEQIETLESNGVDSYAVK